MTEPLYTEPLYNDPVVAEIHAIRERMLAESAGDIRQLMRRIHEREQASGRIVRPAPPLDSRRCRREVLAEGGR